MNVRSFDRTMPHDQPTIVGRSEIAKHERDSFGQVSVGDVQIKSDKLQIMLLALMAPRALYVASADEDLWSDPRGEFLSLAAASPVFALWGGPIIGADQMPALETPFVAGRMIAAGKTISFWVGS